jgi:phospholipase/carboxylesterase
MSPRFKIALPLLSLLLLAPAPARQAPKSLAGFHYLEFLTGDASPDRRLPLIVGLHFYASSPQLATRYFGDLDFPARLLLVEGPVRLNLGFSWFSDKETVTSSSDAAALRVTAADLARFLTEARQTWPTRGKPIVIGASQGGDLAYVLAVDHPEVLAAALPIAAELPRQLWPKPPVKKGHWPAIYVFHGSDDPILPVDSARRTVAHLNEVGIKTDLNEYVGVGHSIPEVMKRQYTEKLAALVGR